MTGREPNELDDPSTHQAMKLPPVTTVKEAATSVIQGILKNPINKFKRAIESAQTPEGVFRAVMTLTGNGDALKAVEDATDIAKSTTSQFNAVIAVIEDLVGGKPLDKDKIVRASPAAQLADYIVSEYMKDPWNLVGQGIYLAVEALVLKKLAEIPKTARAILVAPATGTSGIRWDTLRRVHPESPARPAPPGSEAARSQNIPRYEVQTTDGRTIRVLIHEDGVSVNSHGTTLPLRTPDGRAASVAGNDLPVLLGERGYTQLPGLSDVKAGDVVVIRSPGGTVGGTVLHSVTVVETPAGSSPRFIHPDTVVRSKPGMDNPVQQRANWGEVEADYSGRVEDWRPSGAR